MSETSTHLNLPFLLPSQAQKHVTLNDTLLRLDTLVQLSVLDSTDTNPPLSPNDGSRYIIPAEAAGDWQDKEHKIALWSQGNWEFVTPQPGWCAFCQTQETILVFASNIWRPLETTVLASDTFDKISIGPDASANDINRLHVKAPASLLDSIDGSHQLKINKTEPSQTASIVFQSEYLGRAEIGMVGDNALQIKTSQDGASWQEACRFNPVDQTIHVSAGIAFPNSSVRLSHYDEGTWTPVFTGSGNDGSPTYAANSGHYVRVGRLVTITGRLIWSSLGGLTGVVNISGLPFACRDQIECRAQMLVPWYNSLSMNPDVTLLGGFTEPGDNRIRLWGASNAPEGINLMLQDTHLSDSGEIYFNCTYMV